MDRLKIEEVFKPGAKMDVHVVDFSDPTIQRLFEDTKRRQEEIKAQLPENWTQEEWQSLNLRITI